MILESTIQVVLILCDGGKSHVNLFDPLLVIGDHKKPEVWFYAETLKNSSKGESKNLPAH